MNALQRLQNWYKLQCNGDWEHSYGIKISTLDNPGWCVTVDLEMTPLETLKLEVEHHVSELEWYIIAAKDSKYIAYGDFQKLEFLIAYFLDEVLPQYFDSEFEYEMLIPMEGGPTEIWIEGKAKMIGEETFVITEIEAPQYHTMLTKEIEEITFSVADFESYYVTTKLGDIVNGRLTETFQGVRLAKL